MSSRCKNSKNTKMCLKSQQLEDIRLEDNKIEEWLLNFNKTRSRNYQHLEQLLTLYTQKIISSVAGSNEINLKNHIDKMLIFFHLYWLDIKQDIADHSQYLNKISVLLNVYINIELKTSMEKRISNQVRDKIAAKILAALYIYLNNSEEHIFRVLLRIKHTTEKYTKICNHIFTKSFTNLKTQTISINDVTYIRYLLAFKMWKKSEETIKNLILKKKLILSEEEMRRFEESLKEERINKLALKLLGSRMPKLQDKLKFVPRPPEGQENETLWLIKSDLFDKKEVHKKFLLFEDKMDNSTDLQYNKTIYTDQNCLKSQKHQTNSSGDTSEQKIKKYLGGLRKNNTLSNNENRSDQIYLQKKGSKSLKRMKKKRKKSIGKPIEIIDLTGDDKRKRIKNSKCLKVMKNIMRSKKHINSLKYSNKLMNADVKECSYEDDKNLEDYLMYKSVHDIEISDLTGVCTSVNSRASLNDSCLNPETNEHLNVTNNQMSNICLEFMKEDEKSSMCVEYQSSQNIKEFKTNMKESKLNNCVSPYKACMTIGNAINSYNNSQNKEALTSQEESAMETILKPCQNNADQHSFKQELPSMNCSAMQKPHECYKNNINDDEFKHDVLKKLEYLQRTTDRVQEAIHSSQITKINQKVCQGNGCQNYIIKIDCKPFTNNDTAIKAQGTSHTFNDNYNNTFNDNYKCVYVVNHIDEYVTVHAEKRVQRLDKSNDTCTVSTTFTEDQIVELPLYNHVNFDNVRTNDYDNAKYSGTMIKEQQKMTDCDSSILDDRLLFSECVLDVNSFDIDSNAEVENKCRIDLKSFPKIEETEITKTDVGDFEHINSNDIQSETLEDFFRQFSEQPQINYNNLTAVSTKKSLMYDNDISTVKTQNTLNNIFNTDDTNIICMLSDRNNKCIYVTNHTGDRIMTNTEKKIQHLNNSNDMCTVSTTFTEDQIVESSFDSQHVNSDNRRKCDYKDDFKYPENMMKEQQRKNNCDTSMLNELHPTELPTCTLIDSFELDSKEATEIMKTDCNDIENISFSHNMQTEIERILSNIIFPPTEAVTI